MGGVVRGDDQHDDGAVRLLSRRKGVETNQGVRLMSYRVKHGRNVVGQGRKLFEVLPYGLNNLLGCARAPSKPPHAVSQYCHQIARCFWRGQKGGAILLLGAITCVLPGRCFDLVLAHGSGWIKLDGWVNAGTHVGRGDAANDAATIITCNNLRRPAPDSFRDGSDTMSVLPPSTIQQRIVELEVEHRDLDLAIDLLVKDLLHEQLHLRRLKKRRLLLKDHIAQLKMQLVPDILA